ncbi:MAG: peptidylprolyl isomerase [Gemmataceae bacterium]|nr:peptidylprolyl isomerase [Gemmataceae bacterium]
MATEPRFRLVALAAAALAVPAARAEPPARPAPAAGQRVVAYIHGNVPVTREEFADYLIARGGMDKVDLLVNKRVIEAEAARKGVTVTMHEVEAGMAEDLRGSNLDRATFAQFLKERYGKTVYEWEQDVVRSRLLLGKLARGRVQLTEDDLKAVFDERYGEKREAQVIVWPKGKGELTADVKDIATKNPAEFDKLAANQPNPDLARAGGRMMPVTRNLPGEDKRVVDALFGLKEGEARWIETKDADTAVRCLKIAPTPPDLTLDKVRAEVEKEAFDRALNGKAIPGLYEEVRDAARPTLTVHVPPRPDAAPKLAARVQHPDPRVLAVFADATPPVTREDLGEFLIARGGYEKLEFLVNDRIIKAEAGRRNVAVTPEELEAAKQGYAKKLGVTVDDVVKHLLPKQKMTAFMWEQDVLVPELLMTKLCQDGVKVDDADLQKAFDNKYGEKRQAKIIIWPKDQPRAALREWDEVRKGATPEERDANFDRVARRQLDTNLAAAAGRVAPIGKNLDAENPLIETVVFQLKVGEVSQLFETPAGIMCVKCDGVVPPAPGVTLGQVKAGLEKEVYDRKLAKAIPAHFAGLKKAAAPNLLLKGPPTPKELREGAEHIAEQGADRAGGLPPGVPKPKN